MTAKRQSAAKETELTAVPVEQIEQLIRLIRGRRVILDADLARMYGVPVRQLNQAVKRNLERFPEDFVFQLNRNESDAVSRSQSVILNRAEKAGSGRGRNVKFLPYAFTEHGAIMAANLLRSERAVKVSVFVVRAFVKLREMLAAHRELGAKLDELESKLQDHDGQIVALIDAIRELMNEPRGRRKPPIGFQTEAKPGKRRRGQGVETSSTGA